MEKARAALETAMRSRPSYNTAYENLSSLNVRLASRAYARALQIDDSAGAPKLSLLKSLGGSAPGAVTVASTVVPAPAPGAPLIAAAPPPGAAASQASTSERPHQVTARARSAAAAARSPARLDAGAASKPAPRDTAADAAANAAKSKPVRRQPNGQAHHRRGTRGAGGRQRMGRGLGAQGYECLHRRLRPGLQGQRRQRREVAGRPAPAHRRQEPDLDRAVRRHRRTDCRRCRQGQLQAGLLSRPVQRHRSQGARAGQAQRTAG